MGVTAVVLGCSDRHQVLDAMQSLEEQTVRPDEVVAITCCMEPVPAHKSLQVLHQDKWGQEKCDYGIRLADSDNLFLFSADDAYEPTFIAECLEALDGHDIVLVGFKSHLVGTIETPEPKTGRTSRGAFMVKRELAQSVAYSGREYSSDGAFIEKCCQNGAFTTINHVLHYHN